jgi:hypothetical protein
MIAEEIMTHNVATVRSDERLSRAVATLVETW